MTVPRSGLNREDKVEFSDETTIKCYRCFSTQVKRVCHHCGRYQCEKCEPFLMRWLRPGGLDALLFKDHEFFELYPLEREFRSVSHCRDHIHYTESFFNVLIWLIPLAVGLFLPVLLLVLPEERELALMFGVLALFMFLVLLLIRGALYQFVGADQTTGSNPLFPRYKLEITENISANFDVNENSEEYLHIPPGSLDRAGKAKIYLLLTPDDYEQYESMQGRVSSDHIRFSAGYLGLSNLSQVTFGGPPVVSDSDDKLLGYGPDGVHHSGRIRISGEIPLDEFRRLCQNNDSIKIQRDYKIEEKACKVGPSFDKELVFWILPNLTVAGAELTVSINFTPDLNEDLMLEYFKLDLPDPWSRQVIDTDGVPDRVNSQVRWTKYRLSPGHNELRVRFATPLRSNVVLSGEYKISIDKLLLSKLEIQEEGHLWYANGQPVRPGQKRLQEVNLKTEFVGELHFNTSAVKLQCEFTSDSKERFKPGLRPDHELVSEIVDALKEGNVDVKSVIETPARIGEIRTDRKLQLWDHYWEISGRLYISQLLQYLEVHVVVYGKENPADPENQGYVKWRLYLRACVPVDDDALAGHLERIRGSLHNRIEKRLEYLHRNSGHDKV